MGVSQQHTGRWAGDAGLALERSRLASMQGRHCHRISPGEATAGQDWHLSPEDGTHPGLALTLSHS